MKHEAYEPLINASHAAGIMYQKILHTQLYAIGLCEGSTFPGHMFTFDNMMFHSFNNIIEKKTHAVSAKEQEHHSPIFGSFFFDVTHYAARVAQLCCVRFNTFNQ